MTACHRKAQTKHHALAPSLKPLLTPLVELLVQLLHYSRQSPSTRSAAIHTYLGQIDVGHNNGVQSAGRILDVLSVEVLVLARAGALFPRHLVDVHVLFRCCRGWVTAYQFVSISIAMPRPKAGSKNQSSSQQLQRFLSLLQRGPGGRGGVSRGHPRKRGGHGRKVPDRVWRPA